MKKTIALITVITLILTLFAACGSKEAVTDGNATTAPTYEYTHRTIAEPVYIEPAEGFAGGDGSESNPFQISNAAELAFMERAINNPDKPLNNEYDKAYYVITADIELNNTDNFDSWSETAPEYSWKTIDGTNISLVLDGNGHTISGLYINTDNKESRAEYGLFGTFSGTVRNLNIEKSYICASGNTSYVGTIAAYLMQDAVIENCTVNSTIECYDNDAGGLIGYGAGGFVMENLKETDEIKFPVVKNCTFDGTIRQIKKESLNNLGGIVASGSCEITDCVNNGTITFGGKDIEKAGGIIGMSGFGKISNCENKGNIICEFDTESESNVGSVAGGIIGDAFQSATGTVHMSRGLTVENCRNTGKVSAQMYAGGICGNASNDNNEWCLTFSGCENSGEVVANDKTGGIIGVLSCNGKNVNGENVVVESCTNTADIKDGTPGGIIGHLLSGTGDLVIRNCKNSGNITSVNEQNSGGIIGYWLMDKNADIRVTVENCENSGKIESKLNAGGIIAYAGNDAVLGQTDETKVVIRACRNSGEIVSKQANGFIGGIAGNWGMKDVATSFADCENSGKLFLDCPSPDKETTESEARFTISRIIGGIVGRVGSGLLLTTDSDEVDATTVNSENATIIFEKCSSTGTYVVSNDENQQFEDGKEVYENYFGGIIGNTCAEEGFSISVKDCTYSEFDRGLGNTDLPDVGTKK